MDFTNLFSSIKVKNIELRNRIVMLPMSTNYFDEDGTVGDRFINFFVARARGGVGLIDIPFSPIDDGAHNEPGLFHSRFIPGIHNLTSRIHDHGAKVAAQLIISYKAMLHNGIAEVIGPSAIFNKMMRCVPRELTKQEIHSIVKAYGAAAARAREGGFDAVDVLVGAGYLLNRFLSPISNNRTDEYGGNLENRMRIILEVIKSIKMEAGDDFPIFCRLNVEEKMPGGHTIEDSKEVLRELERNGIDMFILYTGWHESPIPTVGPFVAKGAFSDLAEKMKETVQLPVVASNRINDPFIAEKLLSEEKADLIGMARALLADPEFANKAREGRVDEIVPCIACGECLGQLLQAAYKTESFQSTAENSLCSVNPIAGMEEQHRGINQKTKKTVYVIGSGPAGMTAAMTAASRGHRVELFEINSSPGGRLCSASIPPSKGEIQSLIKSLYARAVKSGVSFQFNTELMPQDVRKEDTDVLIIALGAEPFVPPIKGINRPNVFLAEDVLTGKDRVSGRIIVIGGGLVGCETAEYLVENGIADVTVIEMLGRLADNVSSANRPFLLERLRKAGLKMYTNITVTEITDTGIVYVSETGSGTMPAECVVLAAGFKPDIKRVESFEIDGPYKTIAIGDCVKARTIKDAIGEGYSAGESI